MTAVEIKMVTQMAVTETLRQLGMADGEISERQARKAFGKPFVEAVATGKILPVRSGSGRTATKYYRILDILALQSQAYEPARINNTTTLQQ